MKVIPYVYSDGVPSFTDSFIKSLYYRMVDEGTDKIVFISEPEMSAEKFLSIVKGNLLFHVILDDEENTVAIGWLNRFESKSARMHFCVFKDNWGGSDEIFRCYSEHIFSLKDNDGNKFFTCIVGYIPTINYPAVRAALRNGCEKVGEIPDYFYNYKTGRLMAATIVCFRG